MKTILLQNGMEMVLEHESAGPIDKKMGVAR
jgi:hypothetical protein